VSGETAPRGAASIDATAATAIQPGQSPNRRYGESTSSAWTLARSVVDSSSGVCWSTRPSGSITAETPLLVARTTKRLCSTARKRASARCSHGSCESPNQPSLARLTIRFASPSRTMRRTKPGTTVS
jgi:hypothetical protein